MYATTATSYRAIADASEARVGETVVEELPAALLAAQAASDSQARTSQASILSQADTALAELRAFRDLASPTNAQTLAAVKLLCRVAIGLIRLRLVRLEADS